MDVIALLALVVAVASLAWQVHTARRQQRHERTSVELDADYVEHYGEDPGEDQFLTGPEGKNLAPVRTLVVLTVFNRGRHPIRVTGVAFISPDAPTADEWRSVSVLVDPRDSQEVEFPLPDPKLDPTVPLVAWVRLSTGEEYKSAGVYRLR